MSPDGNYELVGEWVYDDSINSYAWHEYDSYGYDIFSLQTDSNYQLYDALYDTYASGTYDYYSSGTNDDGVTTTTYRNKDGSIWSIVDSWEDDAGNYVTRTFTSDGTETVYYSIDDEHYYITDLTTGQVTVAPETNGDIIVASDGSNIAHFRYEGDDAFV